MRFAIVVVSLVLVGLFASLAEALPPGRDTSRETLVLNASDTELPMTIVTRRGALIQNGGPNSIFCALGPQADAGSGAVLDKSFEVKTGATLWMPGAGWRIFCRAKTADQTTGAGTRVQEVP